MHDELEDTTIGRLLDILQSSPIPLSTREIGIRLRLQHLRLSDYKIGGLLRSMIREGQVEYRRSRWVATSSRQKISPASTVSLPRLSTETLSYFDRETLRRPRTVFSDNVGWTEPKTEPPESEAPSGRWETFRKLVAYYRQCISNEEGADASAFQNEIGKRFIYLRRIGSWYPKPGLRWSATIPLGPHLSPLLNALPSRTEDQALVIGYPVQAYYRKNEDEPDTAIIRPIFFFTVEHVVSRHGLVVGCENPRPEVNLGWLDYAFSHHPDRQRSFLSACGFINRWQPNDEVPGLERGELTPSLDNLVSALAAFMPERVQQPLALDSIPDHPLHEPFETGIYNRAVLMLARRTRYNATLLKELAIIEKAPDAELDGTALRHIFSRPVDHWIPDETGELLHEGLVADIIPLNAEQRQATASLLKRNITVVTGPPGTGKSQVVSSAMVNARLFEQTVLFASRNHKAIDAVVGRLSDNEGRSFVVRTNSKDDPNLNFTFAHAIRDMLAEPQDKEAVERLKRTKEELNSLLEERGVKATYARRTAEDGTALGELEERMSYVARELSEEMTLFLDIKPERFPTKAVGKVTKAIRALHHQASQHPLSTWLFYPIRGFWILLWLLLVRYRLRRVSGAPKLATLLTPEAIKALLPQLLTLERASEYARLRIECLSLEAKLQVLPPVEETTQGVAEISRRIEEVASWAISLDLDSRRGLPPGADREELSGLRAALNAMRTGLEDGIIRAETVRVLVERTPYILKIFPCWAVTSLSAGSRIPLVASMFDVAIVDEASQSDIPSAIPILYRARRAGVVGDPFQLTHVSKLTTVRDTMLRRQVGLERVEDVRFAYTESSLYDLFASTHGVEPVFLSETYRSAADIADYSNLTFYNGRLRVATNPNRLVTPHGMSPGIHWTEVVGEVQSGGGSGCYCRQEVDEVVRIVRIMLLDNNFRGTLGIVTPFRHQANRIRDALFESETPLYEALLCVQAHVDTAHGFQGDERDVIMFSLCAGPDMPRGSQMFLRESGNLFNVAVSRARAVLHVVGNRDWARRCGILHVERLASPHERQSMPQNRGPWHPHESPWEEKLYKALVEAGLKPRPQFPVSSRRLDLALVQEGTKSLKIDIEVDGDCHRNPDGTRKADDLWRDLQLQGLGWKVMRFWTYQLREDMAGCVDKIRQEWSGHERRDA